MLWFIYYIHTDIQRISTSAKVFFKVSYFVLIRITLLSSLLVLLIISGQLSL